MFTSRILKSVTSTHTVLIRSASYYITTPIFYVNSSPHIGHVHTLFVADALNIYHRLKLETDDTIFSTGTDEHGIKIQTAAQLSRMTCTKFCDINAIKFSQLFSQYNTTVTDFIRTTQDRHKRSVQTIWNRLYENDFIYESTYSGWYCASDEVFVPESQVIKKEVDGQDTHIDANGNPVVWSSETNYMFKLSAVEDQVINWLAERKPILPTRFNEELVKQVSKVRIGDISISRPKERLQWGIEVPNDPSQTIYVWLDALTNYLTVVGYPCEENCLRRWPIDCQVLGKDIIKFHAIYWPAFLIALSLPLPKRLICHSHWLVDSMKMSKSKGNVVDPWKENEILTLEGLRYYLLRASTTHSDTDYSRSMAIRRINSELADTYGNLISRSCAVAINPGQKIPTNLLSLGRLAGSSDLLDQLRELGPACAKHFENADFYKGVDEIMSVLRLNNRIYEDAKPWKLVKELGADVHMRAMYHNLQAVTFEVLRVCSILLQPIVPNVSKAALDRMDVRDRFWDDSKVILCNDNEDERCRSLGHDSNAILFKRIKA